jgi:hypothetical protein
MSTSIFLLLVMLVSVVFWMRYLYVKTLKSKTNRIDAVKQMVEFGIYFPIGLQAIFLFCFALFKIIPLSNELLNFFEGVFFKNKKLELVDFYGLKIIFLGSIIMVLNYALFKKIHASKNTIDIVLYKLFLFLSSVFFYDH